MESLNEDNFPNSIIMYKKKKKIEATYFICKENKIFILQSDRSFLYIYDLSSMLLLKIINANYGGGLYDLGDVIIDEHCRGVSIKDLTLIDFFPNEKYYYSVSNKESMIVRFFVEEFKVIFFLARITKNVALIDKQLNLLGQIRFFTDSFLVTNSNIYIYVYKKNDFSLLWQQNIQDFFPEEEIEIYSVHPYKNTFIVIAKMGIVCLSQKDGSLIWKCDHYARTMEIVGHYGYVCTSLSFYRVDLDTGEFYNYNRKYSRLPDFEYNGETYWPSGHKVVYHNGLLWYDVYTSKHPFIIAIDPETATYQWIYEIKDTYEDIEEIRFYDNKMFVTDTGNNLFIYEEKN